MSDVISGGFVSNLELILPSHLNALHIVLKLISLYDHHL